MADLRLGLIGAGVIGRTHIRAARATPGVTLVAVADPSLEGKALAESADLRWHETHEALLEREKPDAVIIAAPNRLHVPIALDCVARRVAVLVEKPVADTVEAAMTLDRAAIEAGVPVLVGHHRRHNPIIAAARTAIASGILGQLVSVQVTSLNLKSDDYFGVPWRVRPGGGPVMINMIHELDLIRHLVGEIDTVQAITSNKVRGFEVEDTAGALLRLANGAVATVTLSDAVPAPWAWDLASGENAAFVGVPADSHVFGGTRASLTLPRLHVWHYAGKRGWDHPLHMDTLPVTNADPYDRQIAHFAKVVRGETVPLVSISDAARTLAAVQAVKASAETEATVRPVAVASHSP